MWLAYSSISLWAENLGLQDELPFVEDLIAGPTISFRKTHSKFHETVAETVASFDCFLYKRDPSSTFWASHHSLVRSFCREPFVSIRCSVRPEKAASFQVVQKHDFIFKIGLSISISIVNIWFEDLCESFRIPPITLCHMGILFWKTRILSLWWKFQLCMCCFFEDNNWKYWSFFSFRIPVNTSDMEGDSLNNFCAFGPCWSPIESSANHQNSHRPFLRVGYALEFYLEMFWSSTRSSRFVTQKYTENGGEWNLFQFHEVILDTMPNTIPVR